MRENYFAQVRHCDGVSCISCLRKVVHGFLIIQVDTSSPLIVQLSQSNLCLNISLLGQQLIIFDEIII